MSKNGNSKRANYIIDDKIPNQDQLIVDYIKDQLEEKMQASAMDINVTCQDGFVHMSGIVDVYAEKQLAEEIARQIKGVRQIENKITVAMDSNITDKHIEKEIVDKLNDSPQNERIRGVSVKVEDGSAVLMGEVDTLIDAHIAINFASTTRGVKDVVNNIEVNSVGEYSDSSIEGKIQQELTKSPIRGNNIESKVSKSIVTLTGTLENMQEAEIAREIAMSIEGVKKVKSRLKLKK